MMVTLTGSSPGGRFMGVAVGRGSTTDGPGKRNNIRGYRKNYKTQQQQMAAIKGCSEIRVFLTDVSSAHEGKKKVTTYLV